MILHVVAIETLIFMYIILVLHQDRPNPLALARKQMLGLVEVTTLSLESLIAASWDAIAIHGDIK